MRTDYSIITKKVEPCPFCGSTNIRYSIKTATNKGTYYGQCYCNSCKSAGPRVRFDPESKGYWIRYAAEDCEKAKKDAIDLWNERK